MSEALRLCRAGLVGLGVVLTSSAPARAAESSTASAFDQAWVVRSLEAQSPALRAAAIALEQSREAVRLEEGKFPYTFQADGSYTRLKTPQLTSDAALASQGDAMTVGAQLGRTFTTGTVASLRLQGQYSNGQSSLCAAISSAPDCYQATLRISLTQPLLSGFGEKVNLASLRAARIDHERQRKSFDRQSSELVRDALLGYWELVYAAEAVAIQKAALGLAEDQLREAEQRVVHGQLAAADALRFRTQVATLTESLINAEAALATGTSELGRLVGAPVPEGRLGDDTHALGPVLPLAAVIERMREQSPALAEQREAVRLAHERRQTAGDEYRAHLEASAWVEAGGVGAGDATPALRQAGSFGAVSVYAGLVFQKTSDEKLLHAARAQAAQAEALAEANLQVAAQQLEAAATQTWQKVEQARALASAARATLEVAARQAENERQRFRVGANTYLDVQVAEDTLRQAQLRVARATVDQIKARIGLLHATGDLLAEVL